MSWDVSFLPSFPAGEPFAQRIDRRCRERLWTIQSPSVGMCKSAVYAAAHDLDACNADDLSGTGSYLFHTLQSIPRKDPLDLSFTYNLAVSVEEK